MVRQRGTYVTPHGCTVHAMRRRGLNFHFLGPEKPWMQRPYASAKSLASYEREHTHGLCEWWRALTAFYKQWAPLRRRCLAGRPPAHAHKPNATKCAALHESPCLQQMGRIAANRLPGTTAGFMELARPMLQRCAERDAGPNAARRGLVAPRHARSVAPLGTGRGVPRRSNEPSGLAQAGATTAKGLGTTSTSTTSSAQPLPGAASTVQSLPGTTLTGVDPLADVM
eukprot:4086763-Prymnesium_polylepis.1